MAIIPVLGYYKAESYDGVIWYLAIYIYIYTHTQMCICNNTTHYTTHLRNRPSIHILGPASLGRRLHSSLFSVRLLHPLTPRIRCVPPDDVLPSCSWFFHWSCIMKLPIKNLSWDFFSSSILIIRHANSVLLILKSSTIFISWNTL